MRRSKNSRCPSAIPVDRFSSASDVKLQRQSDLDPGLIVTANPPRHSRLRSLLATPAAIKSFRQAASWVVVMVGTLISFALPGCVSSSRSMASIEMVEPQINHGLLTTETKDDGLQQMVATLEKSASSPAAKADSVQTDRVAPPFIAEALTAASLPSVAQPQNESSNVVRAVRVVPSDASKLIRLPRLSSTELTDMLSALGLKLEAEMGYKPASSSEFSALPSLPSGLTEGSALSKATPQGLALVRFGHRRFLSQPAQLWVQGVLIHSDSNAIEVNPDLDLVSSLVAGMITSSDEMRKNLRAEDISHRLIRLSYIDVAGAMIALKGFGVRTAEDLSMVEMPIEFANLPMVAPMPAPDKEQTALIGGAERSDKGAFESSVTPSVATPLPAIVNAAPGSQLLVFFHPAHPEQFGRVKQLLDDFIDRADRQIFVEGMVLEISEEGLSELGIEWEFREASLETIVGSLASAGAAPSTFHFNFDDLKNFDKNWVARLKALVRDGKAEVLSRPSVLTLNNRQATIRVGTDIPIATSLAQGAGDSGNKIAFDFKYLATGISLNIMPRSNENGDQVSLLVDTIVSSVVPGADLEVRSSSGEVLASAPTMATRRIQTYARIDNNTPFIIGGLVSKEFSIIRDKVPLLGDIPYLGALFRTKRSSTKKREVIVVLTPHVLAAERGNTLGQYLPKDEDRFDEFGNKLFRDTYRIRSQDIFDLKFITDNPRLQHFQSVAQRAIEQDFRLASTEPYSQFADGRIPGENILVHRMAWEVVRRLSSEAGKPDFKWLDSHVNPQRLIAFESQQAGGFNVQFFERILTRLGDSKDYESFFTKNQGKALVLTFHSTPSEISPGQKVAMPTPEISLVSCPDQKAWSRLLWDLNQPDEKGAPRHSVIVHDKLDLVRLQRVLILKQILALNGGESKMALKNFSLGKVLLMPEAKKDQFHLIDADAAQYFFEIEKYYEATLQVINDTLQKMEETVSNSEVGSIPSNSSKIQKRSR
ncbi:MAG: type II secretion system protein GspD [Pedosphaera sp.]|nr:type II secretion system protein GspD [Pedosphaera sp.]